MRRIQLAATFATFCLLVQSGMSVQAAAEGQRRCGGVRITEVRDFPRSKLTKLPSDDTLRRRALGKHTAQARRFGKVRWLSMRWEGQYALLRLRSYNHGAKIQGVRRDLGPGEALTVTYTDNGRIYRGFLDLSLGVMKTKIRPGRKFHFRYCCRPSGEVFVIDLGEIGSLRVDGPHDWTGFEAQVVVPIERRRPSLSLRLDPIEISPSDPQEAAFAAKFGTPADPRLEALGFASLTEAEQRLVRASFGERFRFSTLEFVEPFSGVTESGQGFSLDLTIAARYFVREGALIEIAPLGGPASFR
jgi:hypothetical protein